MELVFLGTGAGVPSKERNVTSIALSMLQDINHIWLFDCGEATQHQILQTSIKPRKINKIFITHLHGDHIFGLPGLLSSRSFQGGDDELTVYGPPGIKKYIETSLEISGSHLTYPLHIIEYTEGKIYEDKAYSIFCKKLDHGIPSYGFRIVENDQLGELLVDKLIKRGIKPGPIYNQIKNNEVTVLPDGQTIRREDVLGPPKKGRVVVIFGDTRYSEEYQTFVQDADVLVHEATFSEDKSDLAQQYYHSTTVEAATLAKNSNVQRLILTHISSRYQKDDLQQLLDEAQAVFSCTDMASDFYRTSIK